MGCNVCRKQYQREKPLDNVFRSKLCVKYGNAIMYTVTGRPIFLFN